MARADTAADSNRDFVSRARAALESGEHERIGDADLREVLTLAVKLYAAKVEARATAFEPIDARVITPTEIVVTASEMVRAGNLNLFDLSMWYRRPTAQEAAMLGAR